MRAPRKGSVWSFEPVLLDRASDHTRDIQPWTLVRVIQPFGCPKNGTMGMTYVEYADDGTFIGLVCINSLAKPSRRLPVLEKAFLAALKTEEAANRDALRGKVKGYSAKYGKSL